MNTILRILLSILVLGVSLQAMEGVADPTDQEDFVAPVATVVNSEFKGNWTETFVPTAGTKVGTIVHTPKEVRVGDVFSEDELTTNILDESLTLKVNSTREEFIAAIGNAGISIKSFSKDVPQKKSTMLLYAFVKIVNF